MKKEHKKILIMLAVLICIFLFLKPWLISNYKIQNDILKIIPIGTDWYEALDKIDSQRKLWLSAPPSRVVRTSPFQSFQDELGVARMRVKLEYGHFIYRYFVQTYVVLSFGEDLMLREVKIQRAWKI